MCTPEEVEARRHKLKRTIPTPNSYFMKIRCSECSTIALCFSHANIAITCASCNKKLCRPTGGKVKIATKCAFNPLGLPKPVSDN